MNKKQKKQLRRKLKRQLGDKFYAAKIKDEDYWNDTLWSFLVSDW